MSDIEELESRVRGLSGRIRNVPQTVPAVWRISAGMNRIEADSKAGKPNEVIEKARQEMARGEAREL